MNTTDQQGSSAAGNVKSRSRGHCRFDIPSCLFFAVVLAVVILVLQHWLNPINAVLWVVFSLVAALPGWALCLFFFPDSWARRVEFWAGGAIIGWAINSYLLLVVGYFVGEVQLWPIWLVGLAAGVAGVIGWRRSGRTVEIGRPEWRISELRVVAFAVAVVAIFVARPFLSVGLLTSDGYAFPWLFGFDFTNRVSIAANAAVGLPPEFFHIHGETFHYYLLTYMFPVAFKQFTGGSAEMYAALVLWCINLALMFTALLVAVLRLIARNARALWATVLTVFVGYSFYWMYVAAKTYAQTNPGQFPATVSDGSWMTYSNVSHLIYRYFLVEPQTVLGLAVLLPALGYFIINRGQLRHLSAGLGIGLALGVVFGADALLTAWALLGLGALALIDLAVSREQFGRRFAAWALMGVVFCVMAAGYYLIGMYAAAGSRSVVLGIHGTFAKIFPAFMLVEFGPLLVLGFIGGVFLLRKNIPGGLVWLLLTATAIFAVLFVQAQYDDQLGLLKGSRFLFILFAVTTAVFWQDFTARPRSRSAVWLVAGLLAVAAPTWVTDWLRTSDTTDRQETVYIQPADYEACRWIRSSLPQDAVIQSSPAYTNYLLDDQSDPYMTPLIANFAERPMAIGCWGMPQMLPDIQEKFYRVLEQIWTMFASTDVEVVLTAIDRYDIAYIYYGPLERKRWPAFEKILVSNPQHFVKEYDCDSVGIYRVVP